jgi:hypothetical protein
MLGDSSALTFPNSVEIPGECVKFNRRVFAPIKRGLDAEDDPGRLKPITLLPLFSSQT